MRLPSYPWPRNRPPTTIGQIASRRLHEAGSRRYAARIGRGSVARGGGPASGIRRKPSFYCGSHSSNTFSGSGELREVLHLGGRQGPAVDANLVDLPIEVRVHAPRGLAEVRIVDRAEVAGPQGHRVARRRRPRYARAIDVHHAPAAVEGDRDVPPTVGRDDGVGVEPLLIVVAVRGDGEL